MASFDKLLDNSSFIIKGYLKGEDTLPIIRRILDPILSINVASFIYEHYYHKYNWIDITDYKSILSFIFKGEFIIPITLFLVVHFAIIFIIQTPFFWLTNYLTKNLNTQLKNKDANIKTYNQYKVLFINKNLNKSLSKMDKLKTESEKQLLFIVKVIIISLFFFCALPEYNLFLFILMMSLLIFTLLIIWICHLIFSFMPVIFGKIKSDGKEHSE